MKLLTQADVVHLLRAYIGFDLNQGELAERIGIRQQALSEILNAKRGPCKKTVAFLGLEKVTCYRKVNA